MKNFIRQWFSFWLDLYKKKKSELANQLNCVEAEIKPLNGLAMVRLCWRLDRWSVFYLYRLSRWYSQDSATVSLKKSDFEVIQTQSSNPRYTTSAWHCFRTILREESFAAFTRRHFSSVRNCRYECNNFHSQWGLNWSITIGTSCRLTGGRDAGRGWRSLSSFPQLKW